jgi:hypothetical protein
MADQDRRKYRFVWFGYKTILWDFESLVAGVAVFAL